MHKKKAVALISGGLDSALAVKLVSLQDIEVLGLHLSTPLWDQQKAISTAKELNIPLEIIDISKPFLQILMAPYQQWCIMCRILMLKEAKEYLEKVNASFIITGEVLGQNSKSQSRKGLNLTAKKANVEHIIVRPLSGQFFNTTKEWIKKENLLSLHGPKRTAQLKLATSLGLSKNITPTKECLLTNNTYLRRLKDLIKYSCLQRVNDLELLKLGRHFRLSNTTKVIVARNRVEEIKISKLITKNDMIFKAKNCPLTIMQGEFNEENIIKAGKLCVKYGKTKPKYPPFICVKYKYLARNDKEYSLLISTNNVNCRNITI